MGGCFTAMDRTINHAVASPTCELPDLHEEVPEVLLERGNVLVQVEQSRHRDLDLIVGQVGERSSQQVGHELLDVRDVGSGQGDRGRRRVEVDRDLARLDKGEHVGQDGGVHRQPGSVRRVRDNAEHVLQDVRVVRLVEGLRGVRLAGHVLEQLEEDAESGVGHVAHGVFERPDDGVQDQLELRSWDGEERSEAVVVDRLEHHEEVCAVLGELLKVLENKPTAHQQNVKIRALMLIYRHYITTRGI